MPIGGYSVTDVTRTDYDNYEGKRLTDLIVNLYEKVCAAANAGDFEAARFYQKQRNLLSKIQDQWFEFDVVGGKMSPHMGYPDMFNKKPGTRRPRFKAGQLPEATKGDVPGLLVPPNWAPEDNEN